MLVIATCLYIYLTSMDAFVVQINRQREEDAANNAAKAAKLKAEKASLINLYGTEVSLSRQQYCSLHVANTCTNMYDTEVSSSRQQYCSPVHGKHMHYM